MAAVTNSAQLPMKNLITRGIETLGALPPAGSQPAGAFSCPASGWRRLAPTILISVAIAAAAGSCSTTSPFSSVPVAIVLPENQVLKGNASTRIGRGTFQARDSRVGCTGSFNPGVISSDVDVFLTCSNTQRGTGTIKPEGSDSGRAVIRLDDGKGDALFVYGEAARQL